MQLRNENAHSAEEPRRRNKRQRRRLAAAVKHILVDDPAIIPLGDDPLFHTLLKDLGGAPPITVSCQLMVQGQPVTLVAVPDRLWAKPGLMHRLMRVKSRMQELSRKCILLPQSALKPEAAKDMQRLFFATAIDPTTISEIRAAPLTAITMRSAVGHTCLPPASAAAPSNH